MRRSALLIFRSKPFIGVRLSASLKLTLAALVVLGALLQPGTGNAAAYDLHKPTVFMSVIVRSSPESEYITEIPWQDEELGRQLSRMGEKSTVYITSRPLMLTDTVIRIRINDKTLEYAASPNGDLFDLQHHAAVRLPIRLSSRLRTAIVSARRRHYGELLPWKDINPKLPKYAKFTITDLETGLHFRGQRRAGSAHADVQPLSKLDSAIMKKIYGDHWSWQRRAVLVEYEGNVWAGSMNGMPHGGDGIPDNDFRGHFCIHFPGSTTHKQHHLDLAHQIMAYKAAGQLSAFLSGMTPKQLTEVWLLAVNQHDKALLQAEVAPISEPPGTMENEPLLFDSVSVKSTKKLSSLLSKKNDEFTDPLVSEVPLRAVYSISGKRASGIIRLTFARQSPADRWRIERIEAEKDRTDSNSKPENRKGIRKGKQKSKKTPKLAE